MKVLLSVLLASLVSTTANGQIFDLPPPENLLNNARLSLWATHYHVHSAEAISGPGSVQLRSRSGALPLSVSSDDFCDGALEGTIKVRTSDGKETLLNVSGISTSKFVDCSRKFPTLNSESRFRMERRLWSIGSFRAPLGVGVHPFKLQAHRTVAVDKTVIKYGNVIYIPAMRGRLIELSNGSTAVHDGYMFAGDTGSNIKGNHIDYFKGLSRVNPAPDIIGSRPTVTFDAYLVQNTSIKDRLRRDHLR